MDAGVERTYRVIGYRFRVEASTGVVDAELHRYLRPLLDEGDGGPDLPLYRLTFEEGDYVASVDGRTLARHPGPALPATELLSLITHEAIPTVTDRLAFHAGAVGIDDAGVMLPGASRSGKSTLVAALVFGGATYFSDEVAVLDGGRLQPVPRPLSLKVGSVSVLERLGCRLAPSSLGDLDLAERFVTPDDLRPGAVAEECQLRVVIFPSYHPEVATTVEPVTRAEGVATMIRNCFNFSQMGAEGFESLGTAARNARFYRLRSGDLAAAAEAVRSLATESSR